MDVGEKFPEFVLADENGDMLDSKNLQNIRYVLYFYPKDGTEGCTREAQDFTALYTKFMLRNIPVFGVSKNTSASHRKFKDHNNLKVKLLSDPEHILMEKVGAYGVKISYGKEVQGTIRSTYIVGKDGFIEAFWNNVKVSGHAAKVLEKAISLNKK